MESRLFLASQPYTWQNATIEGGGFVDGIFFSPTQQNVIYARTDIGGLYKTTDGGTTWHQLLDFVGSGTTTSGNGTQSQLIGCLSFAIDPENPNNIYADVGEYSGTNGAVFYSTNGGTSWTQTNLSFYVGGNSNGRATGERIAVDPYDSNIVLLGSNANGLWESTNAGHSFSQVSSFSTSASITFVEFKPYGGTAGTPTQNIIVGVNSVAGLSPQVAGNAPTNLYDSTNGGSAWTEIGGTTTGLGKNVLSTSVTTLSRSGTTATVQTASATGFAAGDRVTIAGATPTAYDGTFTVTTVVNTTTFTYTIATGTDTATGTITATANYSLIPNHAAWASDGNIYLTYSDGLAPNGTQDVGGVFRYNSGTGVWANISPQTPGAGSNASFGYLGLALDPESSTTIAVTSINRYSATDAIWRTTTASSASPSWVALYDNASAQNYGYGGYDTTRNTSNAPWVAPFGDGIGNWPATVAIDPYNSGHLLYGDGQGLWATNNATSTTQLTAANSWYFPDYGIEFTAVGSLIAPASGVPLFSAMGDINGFAHTTLTSSPAAGAISSGVGPLDFDQANSNYVVDLASNSTGGEYTTNDGVTWTAFGTEAGSGGGTIAVSTVASSGQPTLVWDPSGALPYYSTNNGTTWTASTLPSGTLTGGRVISDRVAAGTFYYSTENSSDNQFITYKSTNGGVTFTLASTLSTGNAVLVANPYVAGDLWLADYSGVYHSTNSGSSFSSAGGSVQSGYQIALGAPAPGRTNAAIYLWGEIGGIVGLYRSDDSGATYTRINDTADQWGALVGALAADPNVFGRIYIGINGRGIIMGNPVGSLPAGWSDQDINTPGNPGFATNSTTLSTGTVVSQWIVNGGGAGISGASDQFNFASDTETGDGSIVAQITGLNNAGTGTPQAGVMFRAGSTAAGDPFAAIVQTTASQLIFEYRTTSGGSISSTALSGVAIGAEHVSLVRSGSNYSAYYGTDGIHWTQLGSTVAIAAIPSTANVGLAVTSNFNPQLSSATFSGVQIDAPPTVATPASSSSVTTTSAKLSVLGADADGQANLTYTWATTGTPPSAVTFSANGTNAAQNTTASYTKAGYYSFIVTITNTAGVSVTSTVNVNVLPAWLSSTSVAVWNPNNSTLTVTGATTVISDPGSDEPIINASGSSSVVTFNPASGTDIHIGGLSLTSGASATVTSLGSARTVNTYRLLVVGIAGATVAPTYSIDSTSTLDLADNDMAILYGTGTSPLSAVTTELNEAYDNRLWIMPGLTSSVAKTSSGVTALGFGEASVLGLSTFDGLTLGGNAVLVKYTLTGDANLDGNVNLSDYNTVINNFNASGQTWTSGSFDYSGVVSLVDYNAVINNFNQTLANVLPGGSNPALTTSVSVTPVKPSPHRKPASPSTHRAIPKTL